MYEINTTSINDLPTDPSAGGSVGGNVNLVISETSQSSVPAPVNSSQSLSLDQSTISQIVNSLQQASLAGVTTLPSRDIPLHTEQLTQDAQIQPNYVPPPQMIDYINESDDESVEPKQKINKNNEPKKEDAQKLTKSKDPFKNLK